MKEKNKKMIIIVTSLLLVVGVSLAYFTASVLLGGDGTSVTGSTTTIQDSTLIVEGTLEFNDLDIYPGHQSVSSIRVTATGNNELIPYNVIWKGTNTLNTPLNFTVYKTSSSIDVNTSCEKKSEVMGGARIYYEECTISNLESLGSPITEGTITTSEEEAKIELIGDEFITSTQNGTSWYYYVILEYPNLEESQNIDMGGTFNGEITIEESDIEPDINIIAAYIEQEDGTYEEVNDIPQRGYTIDPEKSTCSNGAIPSWDITNSRLNLDNLTKSGTNCYLYFTRTAESIILANYDTVLTREDFSTTVTNTTTGTIYKSLDETQYDNDGKVYYFSGNPTDNWVYFGGFYWRIIRINGDGSIRMIYAGTSTSISGIDDQIGTSVFNSSREDNAYVGYMYGMPGSDTYEETHANINDSTVKKVLDEWYENNLLDEYDDYISKEAGFCGDRKVYTGSSWSGFGTTGYGENNTTYESPSRFLQWSNGSYSWRSSQNPTLKCSQSNDLFTVSESSNGNKDLTYSIGLIAADEVIYAGGFGETSNNNYYLYTNQHYWTMSPSYYGSYANVFSIYLNGSLFISNSWVDNQLGVRPVINLSPDVTITGEGTSSNPYTISS